MSGLFIGATHTHAGPGQFHGNALMNRFSSNEPGFDPAWTEWLVDRIAGAVRTAVTERRPARLATGASAVWGLTRNRSLDAYVRNPDVDRSAAAQAKYAAVNPWLHLLRVDDADGPLAAMAIFSIHGTGISHHDRAYNADVWAYLVGELGRGIERSSGRRAVVGAVEGTHGDVAPAVRPGLLVYPEAERVGRGIGGGRGRAARAARGRAQRRGRTRGGVPGTRSGDRPDGGRPTAARTGVRCGHDRRSAREHDTAWCTGSRRFGRTCRTRSTEVRTAPSGSRAGAGCTTCSCRPRRSRPCCRCRCCASARLPSWGCRSR